MKNVNPNIFECTFFIKDGVPEPKMAKLEFYCVVDGTRAGKG